MHATILTGRNFTELKHLLEEFSKNNNIVHVRPFISHAEKPLAVLILFE
ncbi:hypothetical protein J4475_01420 [Candidatus Woesearchaeota archaeon]|nr:hypothetical protein [Candidatus Woesearchaeota archaeon]